MKKLLVIAALAALFATAGWATQELCLKGGFVLNKGASPFYSWLIIQESNYYIQDFISFGYETQFSYYKFQEFVEGYGIQDISSYPLNVFLNSKIKILRKGLFRPYAGAGFGLYTAVKTYPDHYAWDHALATQIMAGVNIGMGERATLQIELKMMNADLPDFKTKFILAAGISY